MSIETLMNEAKSLSTTDLRRLIAFLVALQDGSDKGYADRLAAKIDDTSDDRWLTIEQLEKQLRESPAQ
jgi:hypothetical protein